MSTETIVSRVIEGLDDEDDLKDVSLAGSVSDPDLKYWSHYMRSQRFDTEEAARTRLFELLQHHDKTTPFEPWGESKNRYFSQAIPVYQDRFGKWRVGAPLMTWVKAKRQDAHARRKAQEEIDKKRDEERFKRLYPGWRYPGYGHWDFQRTTKPAAKTGLGDFDESLQESFHSDFSDGTAGEPSAPAPFTSGQGEHAGLPDYKYLERQTKWKKKLKALIQRRDPDGIEQRIGEAADEGEDDLKEISTPDLTYDPVHRSPYAEAYHVEAGSNYLGDVWLVDPSPKVGVLRQLDAEFPWTAQGHGLYTGSSRFKTREEAGRWLFNVRFKEPNSDAPLKSFSARWNQLSAEQKRAQQEGMEDEDDLKDLHTKTPTLTVSEFVNIYEAIPPGHWGRNDWWKYVFSVRNRGDEQRLHELIKENKLSLANVWTVYSFVARPKNVYVSPGMKLPGGAWSLDKVFGYFLTRQAGEGIVYELADHNAYDLG